MRTFTFNGVASDTYFFTNRISQPILPPINFDIAKIPGRHGGVAFNSKLDIKEFVIDVTMFATDQADLKRKVREIAAWLFTEGERNLTFSDEPDRVYWAKASGATDLTQLFAIGETQIHFVAVDPFAYGELKSGTETGGVRAVTTTFNRDTDAYKVNGDWVDTDIPRYAAGKWGNGVYIDESTQNLLKNAGLDIYTGTTGISDGWAVWTDVNLGMYYTSDLAAQDRNGYGRAQKMELAADTLTGAINYAGIGQSVAVVAGTTYTASVFAKATGIVGNTSAVLRLEWWSGANGTGTKLSQIEQSWVPGAAYGRRSVTGMAPTGAVSAIVRIWISASAAGSRGVFWFDDSQFEAKSYATTWYSYDSVTDQPTRAADTLIINDIDKAELLKPAAGAVDWWAYEDGIVRWAFHFDTGTNLINIAANRFYFTKTATGYYGLGMNGAEPLATAGLVAVGLHHFAIEWAGRTLSLYIDGVLSKTVTLAADVNFSGLTKMNIGSRFSGVYQINNVIDHFRIHNINRGAAYWAAAFAATTAPAMDADTGALMRLDNSLAVERATGAPNSLTVTNNGTAPTFPIMTFRPIGELSGTFRLTNTRTGKEIILIGPFISGRDYTIDCQRNTLTDTVTGARVMNQISVDTEFWPLEPGDNTITFDPNNLTLTVTFTERYY